MTKQEVATRDNGREEHSAKPDHQYVEQWALLELIDGASVVQ